MSEIINSSLEGLSFPDLKSLKDLEKEANQQKNEILTSISLKLEKQHNESDLGELLENPKDALDLAKSASQFGLTQQEKVVLLAALASVYRPEEGYQGGPVKKLSSELEEFESEVPTTKQYMEEIWRISVNKLIKLSKLSPRAKQSIKNFPDQKGVKYISSYDERLETALFATQMLQKLKGNKPLDEMTTESLKEVEAFVDLSMIDEVPLDFEIFPPEEMVRVMKERILSIINILTIDQERLNLFLDVYANKLREGNQVKVYYSRIRLEALMHNEQGDENSQESLKLNSYFVLEISEPPNENNEYIEPRVIAYADNFTEGNALYVHRSNVDLAGNWRETFALSKKNAKELCTKIVHQGAWMERALSILS